MVPRGKVGLIVANAGLALSLHGERVIDATYSALVVMITVTTVVTPPALK
jgi:hypothetical protein